MIYDDFAIDYDKERIGRLLKQASSEAAKKLAGSGVRVRN
jgi:hypothetical protein